MYAGKWGQPDPLMVGKAPTGGGYTQLWPQMPETALRYCVNLHRSLVAKAASLVRFADRSAIA